MEELWTLAIEGIAETLTLKGIILVLLGVLWGVIAGALPGITATAAVALALPLTLSMTPFEAVVVLMAILSGAMYGNAIPAVLIQTPGTPAALLTAIEGYAMHRRGEGIRALKLALFASVIGQMLGIILFLSALFPVARIAIRLLNPEIFALCILGMAAAAGLVGKSPLKGMLSAAIGLLIALVGADPLTGAQRFTFGSPELALGFNLVAVLIGLLTVGVLLEMAGNPTLIPSGRQQAERQRFHLGRELGGTWKALLTGSATGAAVGAVPGAGANVGTFIAYQNSHFFSRRKETYGKGSPEGLVAVESAQNAGTPGEMIPTLAMGIPGSAAMAVVLAALLTQGVQAGPLLAQTEPAILRGAVGGMILGALAVAIVGLLLIRPAMRIATVSPPSVIVGVLALTIAGVFSIRQNLVDVWVALGFGALAWVMRRNGYPLAPAALGFVLGGMAERSLRMGLVMTEHSLVDFLTRPFTAVTLILAILLLCQQFISRAIRRGRRSPGRTSPETSPTGRTR